MMNRFLSSYSKERNLLRLQQSPCPGGTVHCTLLNQSQKLFWLNSISVWKFTDNEPSWASTWQCVTQS